MKGHGNRILMSHTKIKTSRKVRELSLLSARDREMRYNVYNVSNKLEISLLNYAILSYVRSKSLVCTCCIITDKAVSCQSIVKARLIKRLIIKTMRD